MTSRSHNWFILEFAKMEAPAPASVEAKPLEIVIDNESDLGSWDFNENSESSEDSLDDQMDIDIEDDDEDMAAMSDTDAVPTFEPIEVLQDDKDIDSRRERDKNKRRLRAVSDAIKLVEPPGSFVYGGIRSAYPPPGIEVEGLGPLTLPLQAVSATALIQRCHLAPYGHGEHTIVDTAVRNTWELGSDQLRITNSAWNEFIDELLGEVRGPLGIRRNAAVEARLYKLLVYEAGGKFDLHRDSEKQDGMFGTMVIVLPGQFQGGELVVYDPSTADASADDSKDEPQAFGFDAGALDPFAVKYVAFYGDCPHEITPVTSGCRLCLTYNLVAVAEEDEDDDEKEPVVGHNLAAYAALKMALGDYFSVDKRGTVFDIADPETHKDGMLTYVLRHKYTQPGLTTKFLKGRDALVAASLQHFCKESNGAFELYLSKAQYKLSWSGMEGGIFDQESDEYSLDPKATYCLSLSSPWIAYGKEPAKHAVMYVRGKKTSEPDIMCDLDTAVVPLRPFGRGIVYDSEQDNMRTGNEGSRAEKWYKTAALVLLPVTQRFRLQAPVEADTLVRCWLPLVDANPRLARCSARAFRTCPTSISSTTEDAERVFDGVKRLGSLKAATHIVRNYSHFRYQPKVGEIFTTVEAVDELKEVVDEWRKSAPSDEARCTSLALSVLGSATDPAVIDAVLSSLKPVIPGCMRRDDSTGCSYVEGGVEPQLIGMLFSKAYSISVDHLVRLVDSGRTAAAMTAPAMLFLIDSLGGQVPSDLRPIAERVRDTVQDRQVALLHNEPYDQLQSRYPSMNRSTMAGKLQAFLADTAARELKLDPDNVKQIEAGKVLEGVSPSLLSISMVSGGAVLKKTMDPPLYCAARNVVAKLTERLARATSGP